MSGGNYFLFRELSFLSLNGGVRRAGTWKISIGWLFRLSEILVSGLLKLRVLPHSEASFTFLEIDFKHRTHLCSTPFANILPPPFPPVEEEEGRDRTTPLFFSSTPPPYSRPIHIPSRFNIPLHTSPFPTFPPPPPIPLSLPPAILSSPPSPLFPFSSQPALFRTAFHDFLFCSLVSPLYLFPPCSFVPWSPALLHPRSSP